MIQFYTGHARPGTSIIFDSMHRDRKRVFVDLRKWDVPVVDGQYEIDQFDGDHAVYLVSASDEGEHRGSIRLLPTLQPHILGSLFPDLCEGPSPVGAQIWEITRGCISPRLPAAERRRERNRLTSAAVEFALLNGISRFVCVADSSWLSQILALGWICEPLGEPRTISGATTGALQIHVSEQTIALLRAAGTYEPANLTLGTADASRPA
ncbi:MAG: autoinducer synthase [Sphingobium sp.]|nr:autoinducer synthase [Sphingobium sp.]